MGTKNGDKAVDVRLMVPLISILWGGALAASIYGALCMPYVAGRMVWVQLGSGIVGIAFGSIVFLVVLLLFVVLLAGVGISAAGIAHSMQGLQTKTQSRIMTVVVFVPFAFLILLVSTFGVPWW